mmetsp:Transcript_14187/g.46312  ORF Transcript_14187/g.46312 Transcript_14187/m.46312 type:complete len:201 (-) Transcript_14187:451-1053(-)
MRMTIPTRSACVAVRSEPSPKRSDLRSASTRTDADGHGNAVFSSSPSRTRRTKVRPPPLSLKDDEEEHESFFSCRRLFLFPAAVSSSSSETRRTFGGPGTRAILTLARASPHLKVTVTGSDRLLLRNHAVSVEAARVSRRQTFVSWLIRYRVVATVASSTRRPAASYARNCSNDRADTPEGTSSSRIAAASSESESSWGM